MTNRQPKGRPAGGQFAEDRKPDGNDLTITPDSSGEFSYSPEVEAEFESIWRGEKRGFSESKLKSELAYYQNTADGLDNKTTPRVLSGKDDTFDMARHWVDSKIGDTLRAIATRGRSSRVNQMNVVKNLIARGITPEWVLASRTDDHSSHQGSDTP